jgi:hypothetical protein
LPIFCLSRNRGQGQDNDESGSKTCRDLNLEEARLNGKVNKIDEIKTANLERSGEISVLPGENGKS